MNAHVSNWWHMRGAGEQEEQGVTIAPPNQFSFAAGPEQCVCNRPINRCAAHWKRHAATLKYFEWYHQHGEADRSRDLPIARAGVFVPEWVETDSGVCTWDIDNTFLWS